MVMIAKNISALLLCFIPLIAVAQDPSVEVRGIRLFNVEVLGKSIDSPVVLLERKKPGLADPILVQVDIENDRYFAATICYPKEVPFELARTSINQQYSKFERSSKTDKNGSVALWRNTDKNFSIQLTTSNDAEYLQLILITFRDPGDEKFKQP